MGHPRPLFRVFQIFKKHYNFTTNTCEKCPSSIQYWDLNPQPSGHESLPITTRPGLRPKVGVESLPETLLWNGQRKPSLLSDSQKQWQNALALPVAALPSFTLSLSLWLFLSLYHSFFLSFSFFFPLSLFSLRLYSLILASSNKGRYLECIFSVVVGATKMWLRELTHIRVILSSNPNTGY